MFWYETIVKENILNLNFKTVIYDIHDQMIYVFGLMFNIYTCINSITVTEYSCTILNRFTIKTLSLTNN